jgi:hypothetical protein
MIVTPEEAIIDPDQTQRFSAILKYSNGKTEKIQAQWSVSDENIATIDQEGVATALAPGIVTITATYEDLIATATLKINDTTIIPQDKVLLLDPGQTRQLKLIKTYSEEELACTWESSNPLVATVDDDGLVTAIDYGETIITATFDDRVFTIVIEVGLERVYIFTESPFGGDSFYRCSMSKLDETRTFTLYGGTPLVNPPRGKQWKLSDKLGSLIIWESSNPEIATLESNGVSCIATGVGVEEGKINGFTCISARFLWMQDKHFLEIRAVDDYKLEAEIFIDSSYHGSEEYLYWSMDIWITNAFNVYTWGVAIGFYGGVTGEAYKKIYGENPDIPDEYETMDEGVFLDQVIEGDFLLLSGVETSFTYNVSRCGFYSVANIGCTIMGDEPGTDGGGILATLVFKVKGKGIFPVDLDDIVLLEPNGNKILPYDGSYFGYDGKYYTGSYPQFYYQHNLDVEYYCQTPGSAFMTIDTIKFMDEDGNTIDYAYEGEYVTFEAIADGDIARYKWDFGDGFSATGKVVKHKYIWGNDTFYPVTLTVIDGKGRELTYTRNILIRDSS